MKKIKITAALLSALMLCSCAENTSGEREDTSAVTTASAAELTEGQTAETEPAESETTAETTSAQTEETVEEGTVLINGKSYSFYNGTLYLSDFEGSVSDCIEYLKEIAPSRLVVDAINPSDKDCELLFTELPECETEYRRITAVPDQSERETGFQFYVNPLVEVGYDGEWRPDQKYFCANFDSYSSDAFSVDTLKIYFCRSDNWEPVKFRNGEESIPVNFTIEASRRTDAYEGYDFILSEDDFDYEAAPTGKYKAVVIASTGEKREMEFYINNSELTDFLTEEQAKVISDANELLYEYMACSSHIPDDFDAKAKSFEDFWKEYLTPFTYKCAFSKALDSVLINADGSWQEYIGGDRGSNIMYWGKIYRLVSSDDNRVIIRESDIYYHEDNPYDMGYIERNLCLVNTENGWKVDILPLAN